MRSLVLRALGGLVIAGAGPVVAAAPAAAADTTAFRLVAGGITGFGSYEHRVGGGEQPRPPIQVTGVLSGRPPAHCAVIQIARSGPADGIEWQTFGRHCGPGRTAVRVEASYLFRGVKPPVRLCAGRTVAKAERGQQCDQFQPSAGR